MRKKTCWLAALLVFGLGWTATAPAMDQVVLRRDGREIAVDGRLLVEAQDGGLMVLARNGTLWIIPPEEQLRHTTDNRPFEPLTPDELSVELLAELPPGFKVFRTAHYLICYNTSRAYAEWCGSLFERLYKASNTYWRRKGFKLSKPEFTFVAIVFADRAAYVNFARGELGDTAKSVIGYFSLRTNRMTMYDLTGSSAPGPYKDRRSTTAKINALLSQPRALQTTATVVHEATHQIAYNCGLHTRYSDCPLWFSEGIAVYFETPDLRSAKGWRSIGAVNRTRLIRFHQYASRRPADSLLSLIRDDTRFRDPELAPDAYAETWALTYFLIRQRGKQYVDYLKLLSQKKPLCRDTPETRLSEFQEVFGDLETLEVELLRYLRRVRLN